MGTPHPPLNIFVFHKKLADYMRDLELQLLDP